MSKQIDSLDDLIPDARNANKGTERGVGMLGESMRRYGAGRSVLVDKHGSLIAGNKTVETAADAGLEKVRVVQTEGDELVVVQRTDLDLGVDPGARALAYADNRAGEVGLDWDAAVLEADMAEGVDLGAWWFEDELGEALGRVPDFGPVGEDEQGKLDEKKPTVCPECGHEFTT